MKKLFFLLPLIFLLPLTASAACGSGYSFCQTMTVNHLQVPSTQTSFTVLATTTQSVLETVANGGHVNNTVSFNGQTVPADLVFSTASDCSALMSWDVEDYSATTGRIEAWVLNSSLSSSVDTVFYMCYGKSSVSTYQGGSVGAAWDGNYAAVWHFADGTTLNTNDSTSNANNLTNHSATAVSGKIDGSMALNGTTQYADRSSSTSLNQNNNLTIEAWVNLNDGITRRAILTKYNGSTAPYFFYVFGANLSFFTTGAEYQDTGNLITNNVWHHVAVTVTGTSLQFYVDGVPTSAKTIASGSTNASNITIGAYGSGTGYFWLNYLDEIRFSINTIRSADWIATEYNNQVSVPAFLTIGAEQAGVTAVYTPRFAFMFGTFSFMGGTFVIR